MNPREEHLATRRAAGLFDFSFMGLYEFDNKLELQALQTRYLDALVPGQIAYTLLLKGDGAVLIDATVWRLDAERFWLFTGKRSAYGGSDRSGEFAILSLQGPASGVILSRLIGKDAVLSLRYFRFGTFKNVIAGRIGYSGELGYELLVPADEEPALRHRLLHLGAAEGLRECTWAAADSLRIESGYVLFDREIDGQANPRELGLGRLVSSKTDFEMRRKLVGLEILDTTGRGDLPGAEITSECSSPTLGKPLALGFVAPGVATGTLLRANDRIARVAALPFYDPERRRPRDNPL
ncbi:MAG TPA: aminomethyltransferase family protein [Burkholderiales bacterium]|nr:aminomethyltransferase family protein [Burkholderiales bacterium]